MMYSLVAFSNGRVKWCIVTCCGGIVLSCLLMYRYGYVLYCTVWYSPVEVKVKSRLVR